MSNLEEWKAGKVAYKRGRTRTAICNITTGGLIASVAFLFIAFGVTTLIFLLLWAAAFVFARKL